MTGPSGVVSVTHVPSRWLNESALDLESDSLFSLSLQEQAVHTRTGVKACLLGVGKATTLWCVQGTRVGLFELSPKACPAQHPTTARARLT